MDEILPGLWHWTAFHEGIRADVSSYWLEPAGALIDPMIPPDGMDAFAGRTSPEQVILTTGLHTRDSARLAQAFGCPIRVSRAGAERIGDALEVETYDWRDEVAPGVTALEIGVLCPDEGALHLDVDGGAIALADALVRYGGTLAFVPDPLLGDDPEEIKAGLRERFEGLLARDFEHLLFAHGSPIVKHGKRALREFLRAS
jgi:hypothetical protein